MTSTEYHAGFDDAISVLTAPGAPFEMRTVEVQGHPCRVFCNGPQNLCDIYRLASTHAQRTLTVIDDQLMSYAEVFGKAAALGQFLTEKIGKPNVHGNRIAIVMSNRPEWMISFIAVTAIGATAVLVNSRGTMAEVEAALDETDSVMVIADERRAHLLAAGDKSCPMIVVSNGETDSTARLGNFSFTEVTHGWARATLEPVSVQPDDEAIVMFTSGTTGKSKAALFSHRSVLTGLAHIQLSGALVRPHIVALRGVDAFGAAEAHQPASLLAFPLFRVSGCYAVFLTSLMRGGKIVILPKWDAAVALTLIAQEHIASFSGAPAMYWDMLRLDRSGRRFNSLLSVGVGGQALAPALYKEIATAFPLAVLGVGYGMTECGGTVCAIAGEELDSHVTASGRVFPSVDIRIVNEEDVEVPLGEPGEILVRGAMLMREYCKQAHATAEVLQEGWLRTGDIGRLDAEGYLHVVDRKKYIVISGGENISCNEVEAAVMEHGCVAQTAAFGVPDDRLGEQIVVAVVLIEGKALSEHALKQHLGERLAAYKVPRRVVFLASLPVNSTQKVMRHELRRQILAQVDGATGTV
ncbi:fatty acid--CoA ligase [Pandoraea terrae]|uniref:Fatty acid--CoA ligase n=1 Tax=Pandoraea terrae TaxID=1537710 RepID=A0A5E4RPY0_9BURK|nr:class I adenylate-forming enzyme family protein [Pandoraea terrae]VVD64119.1 fatty acid--CoA ligase [Pandoraea terrae]